MPLMTHWHCDDTPADPQSYNVDQDSLEFQSFVDMESVPSITSVLVSGIILYLNYVVHV